MSVKTLKFDEIEVNKKGFCASKRPIMLNLIDANKIVVSNKVEYAEKDYVYFI